jgi:hypothetical protein
MARIKGQSNGTGSDTTVLSNLPSMFHERYSAGVRSTATGLTPVAPLFEQTDAISGGGGETLATGFVEMMDKLTGGAARWLVSCDAISGQTMSGIKKGGTSASYANGQAQVLDAVKAHGGIANEVALFVHGETDTQTNNTAYPADFDQLQIDDTTDTQAVTRQSGQLVYYCSQPGAYPPGSTSATGATKTGSAQLTYLSKAISAPTRFFCVGGTYFFATLSDNIHYIAGHTRVLGAIMAKFVWRNETGQDALPLYPTSAHRTGTSVVVTFHVPVPPLVWRLDLFAPTTTGNTGAFLGFKYYDDSGAIPAVTDAQITASNQVTLTLASTPTGTAASEEVRIAHSTSQTHGTGGTPLADSDPTTDVRGWPIPNMCAMSYVGVT